MKIAVLGKKSEFRFKLELSQSCKIASRKGQGKCRWNWAEDSGLSFVRFSMSIYRKELLSLFISLYNSFKVRIKK